MKFQLFALTLVFNLFAPISCDPDIKVNDESHEVAGPTTVGYLPPETNITVSTTNPPAPNITTPTTAPTKPTPVTSTITPPVTPTSAPITTSPTSTTTTVSPTTPNATIPTTTVKPSSTTLKPSSTTPAVPNNKSTEAPVTPPPPSPSRKFDGPSFIGGIILACGLSAIGFVAFKFYKARTERNYHTLYDYEESDLEVSINPSQNEVL